jgi:polyferredoxin
MKARHYRWLRYGVGSSVLAVALGLFTGVFASAPGGVGKFLTGFQFLPNVFAAMKGSSVALAVVAGLLLLTLLFGRVYCAMLCPLGLWMDLVARLAGKSGNKRHLPWHPGHPYLRVLVFAALLGSLATGSVIAMGFLDPYSFFGRMISGTLRPAFAHTSNFLAARGWVDPVIFYPDAWLTILLGGSLLLLISAFAIWRGRLWCNTLCPVGAVLGLVSKWSLFGIRLTPSKCVACARCEKVCPSQCIDFQNGFVDHSRCTMCLQCMTACRKSGIEFAWLPGHRGAAGRPSGRRKKPEPAPEVPATPALVPSCGPSMDRRGFTLALAALVSEKGEGHGQGRGRGEGKGHGRGGGQGKGKGGGHGCGNENLNQHNKRALMPPSAADRARFQSLCTACQLCVARCPEQVLRPAVAENGWKGFWQPLMDFDRAFCAYDCNICGQVCPTGALTPLPLERKQITRAGMVHFFKGRCVVHTEGTSCGACAEHCPTQAVHMVPYRGDLTIPEIDPDLCIGCGACEFICPVRPHKAIVVDGLEVRELAKPVPKGGTNTIREKEEEFPF